MKLYLIRHAESANNALIAANGNEGGRHSDPEITEIGHQQAARLGEFLAHPEAEPRLRSHEEDQSSSFGVTHLYCSLMTRSLLTAGYVAKACNLPLEALPDVFERYGIYQLHEDGSREGLPGPGRSYFADRFGDVRIPADVTDEGWWNRPAETNAQFVERIRDALDSLRTRHEKQNDTVAVVVHGDFLDQCINELMAVPHSRTEYVKGWSANWSFHNTSISRIDFVGGRPNVVYLNRFDHLPAELITW